jgi:hypothetical protein
MVQANDVLSLAKRLSKQQRRLGKNGDGEAEFDLRAAVGHLYQYAALLEQQERTRPPAAADHCGSHP